MTYYKHLARVERIEIGILLRKSYRVADIAAEVGRHPSTIYREIRRNAVSGSYQSLKANHKSYVRRKYAKYQGMRIIGDMKLREYIDKSLLEKNWSPEQIAGRIAKETGMQPFPRPPSTNTFAVCTGVNLSMSSISPRRGVKHAISVKSRSSKIACS